MESAAMSLGGLLMMPQLNLPVLQRTVPSVTEATLLFSPVPITHQSGHPVPGALLEHWT